MTMVLGLTGGIASGKSTADRFFRQNNIPIIDSDEIAHDLLNLDGAAYDAVVKQFGPTFVQADGRIDRARLGHLVFGDKRQLKILNKITHPLIFQEIQAKIRQSRQANKELVIVDAPLLFESGGEQYCDSTLLIALPEDIQVKRLMERDQLSLAEALERIHSQMPLSQKQKRADYVIFNTGTIENLEIKLHQLLVKLKEEDQHGMS